MGNKTNVGLWDALLVEGDFYNKNSRFDWSPDFRRALGYQLGDDYPEEISAFLTHIHPNDMDKFKQVIDQTLGDPSGKTPYDIEYRLRTKSGEYQWFRAIGGVSYHGWSPMNLLRRPTPLERKSQPS